MGNITRRIIVVNHHHHYYNDPQDDDEDEEDKEDKEDKICYCLGERLGLLFSVVVIALLLLKIGGKI